MKPFQVVALAVAMMAACGGESTSGPDGRPAGSCNGLDPRACRAAPGCLADFCDIQCNCFPTYFGCRTAGDPPPACTLNSCTEPTCCTSDAACSGATCLRGDEPHCGGACFTPEPQSLCTDDQICVARSGPGWICQPHPCACQPASVCVQGCDEDGDCFEPDTPVCDLASSRCVAPTCGAGGACPPDHDCVGATCARRTCTDDAACDGFCVEGQCRDVLGVCTLPPP